MAQDRNYINGAFIREKVFPDGSLFNIDLKVDEFIEQIQAIKNDRGYAQITMAKRKEAEQGKPTHYLYENTYTPKPKAEDKSITVNDILGKGEKEEEEEDLPF